MNNFILKVVAALTIPALWAVTYLIYRALTLKLATVFLTLILFVPIRVYQISPSSRRKPVSAGQDVHLAAVFGSGGHTSEMISLLRTIDITRYKQRTYIYSSGDDFSQRKAIQLETQLQSKHHFRDSEPEDELLLIEPTAPGETSSSTGTWQTTRVHRARKIHQPLWSTPLSSMHCFFDCMIHLFLSPTYPDVIVINGPATAVLVVLASYVLKFLALAPSEKMKIIYVESFARVRTLSLSGRILLELGVCDRFLVQWQRLQTELKGKGYNKVEWRDFLVD